MKKLKLHIPIKMVDYTFYFKRTIDSKVESVKVSFQDELRASVAFNQAEKQNNPSILLGEDVTSVSSLWL